MGMGDQHPREGLPGSLPEEHSFRSPVTWVTSGSSTAGHEVCTGCFSKALASPELPPSPQPKDMGPTLLLRQNALGQDGKHLGGQRLEKPEGEDHQDIPAEMRLHGT